MTFQLFCVCFKHFINSFLLLLFMKLIDLTCPNCNGTIELDQEKEFGFCMYCGHKIYLASEEASKSKKDLGNLSKLLDTAAASDDNAEIIRIANRILELDSNHADAWYWKGYVMLSNYDISGGLACWSNYVENTSIEDLKEVVRVMASYIGQTYFEEDKFDCISKAVSDSILSLSTEIDFKLMDVMPVEYYFTHEVLKNMGDCIIDSQDIDNIVNGCAKIDFLLFDAFTYYPLIDLFYYCTSSLTTLIETALMNNARKSFADYDSDSIKLEYLRLQVEKELFKTLSEKSKLVFDRISDEEQEKLYEYWNEQGADCFFDSLDEIHALSMEIGSALFTGKKRKLRDQKIDEFLDCFVKPLS